MIKEFVEKYDRQIHRFLEIVPGVITWTFIFSPIWAGLFVPQLMAYLVIFFALYWLFQSARTGWGAVVSYKQFKKDTDRDWLTDAKKLEGFEKIEHLIIIPFCNEPVNVVRKTLANLKKQTFPKERIHVVLAMEEFAGEFGRENVRTLLSEFEGNFGHLWATFHPRIPGEMPGKSSNEAWAGKWAKKKMVDELGYNLSQIYVTSNDSDARLHPRYFSSVAYKILSLPKKLRHLRFFQSPIVFYNNLWRVILPVRISSAASGVIAAGRLTAPQELHPYSTYTTSLKMVHKAGYWGVKIIPEDYHIFYKCFFNEGGRVNVIPVFLPTSADGAESTTFWESVKNYYRQMRRWAYGVSDDPYVLKEFLKHSEIPLATRLFRGLILVDWHFFWATKSFIPFSSFIALLINPVFSQTVLAHNLPRISSLIFQSCFIFTLVFVAVDILMRPKHPKNYSRKKLFAISLFDWLLVPIVGLLLSVIPAIDAHTRLMLGKYLAYEVTEKV